MHDFMKKSLGFGSVLLACTIIATPSLATSVTKVPVVNRNIERGHIITNADINIREMDLDRMPRGAMLNKDDLIGLEAKRNIRAGTPVRSDHVRVPPDTSNGQDVTIYFQASGLQLKATGRAMEDGQKGDVIRVMNDASKTIIDAKIIGHGKVVVQ